MGLGERAPSNMPTELIEKFITNAEIELARSEQQLRSAYRDVISGETRVIDNKTYLAIYQHWLELRREEENEGL